MRAYGAQGRFIYRGYYYALFAPARLILLAERIIYFAAISRTEDAMQAISTLIGRRAAHRPYRPLPPTSPPLYCLRRQYQGLSRRFSAFSRVLGQPPRYARVYILLRPSFTFRHAAALPPSYLARALRWFSPLPRCASFLKPRCQAGFCTAAFSTY